MRFRRYIWFLIIAILSSIACVGTDAYAASKKRSSKARTSQTSRGKNRSRNASSSRKSKNRGKKKNSRRGKNNKSSRVRRQSVNVPQPPKEVPSNDSLTLLINSTVLNWIPSDQNPGGVRVNKVNPNSRSASVGVSLNENFTYMPVTQDFIKDLTKTIKNALPDSISDFRINLHVGQRNLSYYINKIDKLPEKYRENIPFVVPLKPFCNPKKGMEGDIIALWHSHGRYFKSGGWNWQRGLLFQSIEDTYTMSYVIPFLVPMLENAGAYVMLPRERDFNRNEVIVDNDTNEEGMLFSQTTYKEKNGIKRWQTGDLEGFIYDLPDFRDTENPFENGTYRQASTIRSGEPSVAAWYADIPEDGEYAVYVSYKSLPNSSSDAHYTVNYSGGSREFVVNQTMGGGTWIYLGTFPLREGYSDSTPIVTLTNQSSRGGDFVVTADAVKIGGGMGNIARSSSRSDIYYDSSTPIKNEMIAESKSNPSNIDEEIGDEEDDDDSIDDDSLDEEDDDEGDDEDIDSSDVVEEDVKKTIPTRVPNFVTSGLPRYLEGARYWMHWAGIPERVYSPFHGSDDYKDDYTSRGHWVNYLAGGSRVLPNREGLKIPVDISFALHSDAGKRADDSTVGTLGIYFTGNGDTYADGTPRSNSRMLTDLLMRQITGDIRRTYEPNWTRRSMWDKSYLEARVAEVPTTLIEILSHQNFGDMQYGLDPNFRFLVSRAIYKAMARFIGERKDREIVIQPLPVKNFAIMPLKKGQFRLTWAATPDKLEPSAIPSKYIILERTEGTLGFHKIGETSSTHFNVKVTDDLIHSYRVIAANAGGQSFPSETLALRATSKGDPFLIINGFSRISAPAHFSIDGRAGFNAEEDFGVPYINDASFAGYQTEFRRTAGEAFGRSSGAYIGTIIAGNSFDYPALYGESLSEVGYGFVSVSAGAVEAGMVDLNDYPMIILILGKQKRTEIGRGASGVLYQAFPAALQIKLEAYIKAGGNLIVSGCYVVSDLFDSRGSEADRRFAEEILGVRPGQSESRQRGGRLQTLGSIFDNSIVKYSNNLNKDQYIVENPDVLEIVNPSALEILSFSDTARTAGVINKFGKGRVAVISVPLESLTMPESRDMIIGSLTKELLK